MKFGIGTAQIKQKYGILKKKTNTKELKNVFKKFDKKIDLIDTAPSYGFAEKFLGKHCNKKYKIVTKLNKLNSKNINKIIDEIQLSLELSLKNLKVKKIYCLMIHAEKDIKIFKNKKIKLFFESIKKKKIISKIGISIYDFSKMEKYLRIYNFDVIQIPLNIFSINDKLTKYLRKLKKIYKFELHVRSILFQGIILQESKKIPYKLSFIEKKINIINNISKIYNSSIYDVAISSIENLKLADYAIIGISNYEEYLRINKYKRINIKKNFTKKVLLTNSLTNLKKIK